MYMTCLCLFSKAHDEKESTEALRAYNRKLLNNILPEHVADHFMHTFIGRKVCLS